MVTYILPCTRVYMPPTRGTCILHGIAPSWGTCIQTGNTSQQVNLYPTRVYLPEREPTSFQKRNFTRVYLLAWKLHRTRVYLQVGEPAS